MTGFGQGLNFKCCSTIELIRNYFLDGVGHYVGSELGGGCGDGYFDTFGAGGTGSGYGDGDIFGNEKFT